MPEPEAGEDLAALVAGSGLFDADHYAACHRDVGGSGLEALEHFLRHGLRLGRAPGPSFDPAAYLAAHGDVAESGMPALLHYLRYGRAEGRALAPPPGAEARRASDLLRARLYILGQTRVPLEGLTAIAGDASTPAAERMHAARDLAVWHLRRDGAPDPEAARHWADLALRMAGAAGAAPDQRARLVTLGLVADRTAGRPAPPEPALPGAAEGGVDILLARAGFGATPEDRLDGINRALALAGLAPLRFERGRQSPYDALAPAVPAALRTGPLVSVIVAAYRAEATLPATLRALSAQSWRDLEVLVVDDASPDGTAEVAARAAAADPRIRLIRLDRNRGAYGARNAALAEARGDFVTLQDADDWCHPERIALQAGALMAAPDLVACTSRQARATPELVFDRVSPEGHLVIENTASLMARRAPLRDRLGQWDEVRVSADNELIRRLQRVFGPAALARLDGGPLSFQRDTSGSAVRKGTLAIDGFASGARRAYLEAQERFHATAPAEALRYVPGARPFPAPRSMVAGAGDAPRRLSCLVAADLRHPDAVTGLCLHLASALPAGAGPMGLVMLAREDPPRAPVPLGPCAEVAARIDAGQIVQVCPGEAVETAVLLLPDPGALADLPRLRPEMTAARIRLLALRPPKEALPGSGRRVAHYDPAACDAAARRLGGGGPNAPVWIPETAGIRAALASVPGLILTPHNRDPCTPLEVLR